MTLSHAEKKTSAGDIFEESRIYIEYACVFILSQITQILADKRQVGEMKLTTITAVLAFLAEIKCRNKRNFALSHEQKKLAYYAMARKLLYQKIRLSYSLVFQKN